MYLPLQLRLTFFYALLLGFALWFFGNTVYIQAQQRAYQDLDHTLSSRATSVRIGKDLYIAASNGKLPVVLSSSINGLGAGDVAIEVLDGQSHLIATTTYNTTTNFLQSGVAGADASPVPWDKQALQWIEAHPYASDGSPNSIYSTITYQRQHVRVYTTINTALGQNNIIQTARSEQDIEQSLSDLQALLWRGGALVMVLALLGGWLITWSVLAAVRRMSETAQKIGASQDFSRRVPEQSWLGKNELTRLASTFNSMLGNLEKAYKHQQRFVADASHELRAPITSIRCNLDLLAKAPDLPPDEVEAALTDARAEADSMGRLVNDLLTLARSDNISPASIANGYRKPRTYSEKVDLDSLLLEVYRQYRSVEDGGQDARKQAGPRIILQDITPAQVYGDADKLKQALVALLDNALKYTPYEGSVALSLSTDDTHALLRVSDTGIGILPDDLPYIFERFYRADPARSRDRGGSGLGLAIVKSIVEEHAGSIEVESTPGKGSTFLMKMPLVS